jgi:hypothetical protein
MRLKIGIGVIFVLLLAATFLMYRLWQEEKKESARLSDNMKSLCTGLEEYKIRDSLNVVENHVDFTKSRNLIIAGVILVSGLGFSDGLTFTIGSTSITLTSLAIAAIAGIVLNAILPGNDYAFGKDPEGDASRGVDLRPHELEQELKNQK